MLVWISWSFNFTLHTYINAALSLLFIFHVVIVGHMYMYDWYSMINNKFIMNSMLILLTMFFEPNWSYSSVSMSSFYRFIFIMGTALAFVFSSHHRKGKSKWRLLLQIVVRCIKLFVLGLMVNSTGANGMWCVLQKPSWHYHKTTKLAPCILLQNSTSTSNLDIRFKNLTLIFLVLSWIIQVMC